MKMSSEAFPNPCLTHPARKGHRQGQDPSAVLGPADTRDREGYRITRKAYVSGLSGPLADRLRRALEVPGIPRYGEAHPAAVQVGPGVTLSGYRQNGGDNVLRCAAGTV